MPFFLESVGRSADVVSEALRIRALDSLSARDSAGLGLNLWRAGRYDEGVAGMEELLERWPDTNEVAGMLIIAHAVTGTWAEVDRLSDPRRLAQYPLRGNRGAIVIADTIRNPTVEKRSRVLKSLTDLVDRTGHLEAGFGLVFAGAFGFVDEAYALLDRAKLGPSGASSDARGFIAYSPAPLFMTAFPELRADPRFVKLCARLGLVEYWLEALEWPDCATVVPYDFKAECEKYRDYPKDVFFA